MASRRAAVVQAAAVGFDLEAGLEKVARLAGQDRDGGAQLVLFPEAFLPGYPRGMSFGTVVGNRTPKAAITLGATGMPRWMFAEPPHAALGLATGGSCIINPLGQVLAGPARGGEEILFADLDRDDIARGKFDFDVVGHYARPDIFRLAVDEEPKAPVVSLAPRAGA